MAKKENRQCSSCGATAMNYGSHDITRIFDENPVTVPAVEGWLCTVCGELEFDAPEAARYFFDRATSLQQQVKSGQAEEIRAIRKRLKLTQRQAAELFGGGANAFSDYERGVTKPARSTVILLHLLDHHPELLDELQRQQPVS